MPNSHSAPLYDSIGHNYDATRRPDPCIADRLAHHLRLKGGGSYLDIACGTGNYTTALANRQGRWHGLDLSGQMLRSARQKGGSISLFQADAAELPFQDGSFDGVLCTMALHHFADLLTVFRESYRVLDRDRFVIFTATAEQTAGFWLSEYFPIAMAHSVSQTPDLAAVLDSLGQAGFCLELTEPYDVQPDLQDLFLYSGKHRPELYLSEEVRKGISTFSNLANSAELERGLARLEQDIESGRIEQIAESYRHDAGDYLFVVCSKNI